MDMNGLKLLEEHKEKLSSENIIDQKYKCGLCHKIIVNAHGPICGCLYCEKCIKTYFLNTPQKPCPCCKDMTSVDDIVISHVTNREINGLKLKCIYLNCNYHSGLKNLLNHIEECDNKISCDFHDVGCTIKPNDGSHYNDNLMDHLLKTKNKLINDNNDHQNRLNILNNENVDLRTELQNLKIELRNYVSKTNIELNQLKAKVDGNVTNTILDPSITNQYEERIESLETEDHIINEKIHNFDDNKSNFNYLEQSIDEGIIWKFDNFQRKREYCLNNEKQKFYSSTFYVLGCCFFLRLWPISPKSKDYIGIDLFSVKGVYDSRINWPFKHSLKIELLNPKTYKIYKTVTLNDVCIESKMFDDVKSVKRIDKFISIVELEHKELFVDGYLLIKCSLNGYQFNS